MMDQYRSDQTADTSPKGEHGQSAQSDQASQHAHNNASPASAVHWDEDVPSDEDETIESSGLAGRAVVERLLNARLIDERNPDGSPKI